MKNKILLQSIYFGLAVFIINSAIQFAQSSSFTLKIIISNLIGSAVGAFVFGLITKFNLKRKNRHQNHPSDDTE